MNCGSRISPGPISTQPEAIVLHSEDSRAAQASHLALDCFVFIPPTNSQKEENVEQIVVHL